MFSIFKFSGRLNRAQFLVANLISLVIFVIGIFAFDSLAEEMRKPLLAIIFVALFVVNTFLIAKRCHDTDRTGWFGLLSLIPVLNLYVVYIVWFVPGTLGPNQYGEEPSRK